MINQITKVYTPAEIAAFKAAIDAAFAVITSTTPVVDKGDKKGLVGVGKERFDFLGASWTVADQNPGILPGTYDHKNHLISNDLVNVYDEFTSYMQPLNEELKITSLVVQDQALSPGLVVLGATLFQSKINAAFKVINKTLSLLYKKPAVKKVIVPVPPSNP